jgi:hypothetical protein
MITGKRMVPLALAMSALGVLVVASLANAAHMRPKAANQIKVALVPAFNPSDNTSTHGPPLGAPSGPPVPSGLGAGTGGGTPVTDGAANMDNAFVKIQVFQGVVGPPDTSDVLITSNVTDVRCAAGAGAGACGPTNSPGRPDYVGESQGTSNIRITDHYNGPPGFTSPGTVADLPFTVKAVNAGCVSTASTTVGSTCTANTSANAAVPAAVKTNKRAVVEVNTINIFDGGPDGNLTTGVPATSKSLTQGIFIP